MDPSDRLRRTAEVPPELAGERADKAAAVIFDEFSRAVLSRWMSDGALTVDGAVIKPRTRLNGGEIFSLDAVDLPVEDWATGQHVEFQILHEDDDLIVVNKPAGLVVHPGAGNPDLTLVNGLLEHRPALARLPRAGIIHRLDKDTSGLLVVAASLQAHNRLVQDLQARSIQRRYLAITEGRMVAGRNIDAPIGRDPNNRTRQTIREDGRAALTRVRVQERYRVHTLVEAELATGRTHQIRVHLSSVGYPLVGDRRYGARGRLPPAAAAELVQALQSFPRQALHAWRLGLTHPATAEAVAFEAPLPEDMTELTDLLRQDEAAFADGT